MTFNSIAAVHRLGSEQLHKITISGNIIAADYVKIMYLFNGSEQI